MLLKKITITGADNKVDPQKLFAISDEHTLVEWGILIYPKKMGQPRYPDLKWIQKFARWKPGFVYCAAHLCGDAVDQFILGDRDLFNMMYAFDRVQLNFRWDGSDRMLRDIDRGIQAFHSWDGLYGKFSTKPVITQQNPANEGLNARLTTINREILFDPSRGNGIAPEIRLSPLPDICCGYAGGINKDNVTEVLDTINTKVHRYGQTWIDMETGARKGNEFDEVLVRDYISACEDWMNANSPQR